jgi:O-antigen/teichoic acid export membrane protein
VLNVAYGRFFRQGALGPREAFGVARELIPAVTVYGILVALGVLGFAELAPVVLGTGFSETGDVLMWLAVLPLLRAWHYLVGDTLTGSGHHAFRSSVQVVVAVINVSLNLWLIPRYSWRGAACATLVSEGVLLVTVATALSLLWRRRVA